MESIPDRPDVNALRGIEGIATRSYFECFGQMVTNLAFHGRSRRPAQDESNALLNLGYAFLCNECVVALEACGLDTCLGLMHGVVYGRKSLALDLMELFRVDVVDRLVLRLANWGMIAATDFTTDKEIGYRLGDGGFRVFVEQYEKHMEDDSTQLRSKIRSAAQQLRDAVLSGNHFELKE